MIASRRSAASCVVSLLGRAPRRGCAPRARRCSAPSRCAERQARRRIRCDFGCGSTSARMRSATACWLSGSRTVGVPARLDVLGDLAQRELAQRREVVERGRSSASAASARSCRVDLARAQPLLQRLGREVDEHDLVGLVEDPVGERLAHADAGQLEDRVVEALEVLDVDGRDDVDAGVEDLVDVLVALLVAHARRVRVRELVDQRELGRAPDDGVDVHLLELERRRARRAGAARPRAPRRAPAVSGRSCGSR